MKSGEARPARGTSGRRDPVQGSLEGILPAEEPAASETPETPAVKKRIPRARADRADDGGADANPLRAALDALEENITLLLARYESLAADAADQERRRSKGELDPVELDQRVRALAADKEQLERHSAFLEERIRGLLSRVRYVIES